MMTTFRVKWIWWRRGNLVFTKLFLFRYSECAVIFSPGMLGIQLDLGTTPGHVFVDYENEVAPARPRDSKIVAIREG